MPREWFIKTKSGHLGPVSTRKLARMARRGKLKPNMAVSPDAQVWFKANKIAELIFPESETAGEIDAESPSDSPSGDEVQWFVLTKHGVAGPFSHRQLRKLARRGRLEPNVGVSRDQLKWTKANKVPGLKFPPAVPLIGQPDDARQAEAAAADGFDVPKMLCQLELPLFIADKPVQRSSRPRQLTWFGVEARPRTCQPLEPQRVDGSWPLWNWPPDVVQLLLFDPNDDAQEYGSPTSAAETHARQLELRLLIDDEPWAEFRQPFRLRQLTLFDVGVMEPGSHNLQPLCAVESWPLFNWPAESVQLRLFGSLPRGGGCNTSTCSAGTVPRQLELSLLAGDDASTWPRPAPGAKQLTLFTVDQRSEITTPNNLPTIEDWPLFDWPPNAVQLRLFAGASDDQPSAGDVPAEQLPPDQAEHAERCLVDSQRGLLRQWSQIREAEYRRRFGASAHIARPQDASRVPVDVYVFPPNQHRPITTLVTSGLSNHRMPVPPGRYSPRAELVLYVDEAKPEYVNLLYFLAQGPLRQNNALYYTAGISHGHPPRPVFPNSVLDGFVFLIPGVTSDFQIHQSTRIADDSLQLLWVVPTTAAERKFLAEQGIARFCWLLNQNQHPLTLNPNRRCYASAASSQAM